MERKSAMGRNIVEDNKGMYICMCVVRVCVYVCVFASALVHWYTGALVHWPYLCSAAER
jgi:hypothetical protein